MSTEYGPEEIARDVDALAEAVAARLMAQPGVGLPKSPFSMPSRTSESGPSSSFGPRVLKTATVAVSNRTTSSTVTHATLDAAVDAARKAQPAWVALPLEKRKAIVSDIRAVLRKHAEELSRMAVEETGLGRLEDKIKKNLLVINKTPGPEFLDAAVVTGDEGLTLTEYAPYGVIGSITPTTNPSETVINNGISMISAGNAVVFNPHPSAKKVSFRAMELMDHVIVASGGPRGVLTAVEEPTMESAQALMKHPGVRLLVVTGGPAVVRVAMASGKKVIAGGPGNPPVVVDETADLEQAARGIVAGASFDNNIICTDEKEVVAVSSIADELVERLQRNGAVLLTARETRELEKIVIQGERHGTPKGEAGTCGFFPTKEFVGKNASVLLAAIGKRVSGDPRLVICEVEEDHPFVQAELLMPLIPIFRTKTVDEAIAAAKRVEHGNGHTAVMYSKNIDNLHKMAVEINTSIFVKNAPNFAGLGFGGEGYTSFTIASPTGEGLTTCRTFSRIRRCTLKDHFRIV